MGIMQRKRTQDNEFYVEQAFDMERHSSFLDGKVAEA